MTDQLPLTAKEIKAAVKGLNYGPGWGANCITWLLAAGNIGSTDPKAVREYMGYKEWFDECFKRLKRHGYIRRGKLCLPVDASNEETAGMSMLLIGMECDGLVTSVKGER